MLKIGVGWPFLAKRWVYLYRQFVCAAYTRHQHRGGCLMPRPGGYLLEIPTPKEKYYTKFVKR